MAVSPILGLPALIDLQGDAAGTQNSATNLVEALLSRKVLDRDLTAPPGGDSNGDVYIPAATATGDWAGKEDNLALYDNGIWAFMAPVEGMSVRILDENLSVEYDGSAWVAENGHQILTDGATITWDTSLGTGAEVTLGGNRTMAAPTNAEAGRIYTTVLIQDGTGSRTVTWNSVFKFLAGTAPTLSTGAADVDAMYWYYDGTSFLELMRRLNLS